MRVSWHWFRAVCIITGLVLAGGSASLAKPAAKTKPTTDSKPETAPKAGGKKASDPAAAKRALRYAGVLQDDRGGPIGGIYPLQFSLYGGAKASRAEWTESHWVAVDQGRYVVRLGEQVTLPTGLDLSRAFIGVAVSGAGEILRERLVVEARPQAPLSPDSTETAPPIAPHSGRGKPAPGEVEYAEKAGFAYEAEQAGNALKLEGMSIDELKRAVARPPKVGAASHVSELIGGKGGYAYEQTCPKGYVVTGVKGAAGLYLDSIQIICSPLE